MWTHNRLNIFHIDRHSLTIKHYF